jgi:hypothetical protein
MATLRFKLWNELTREVMVDEVFEMPEGQAILTIKRMHEFMATLPGEHRADVLKTPGKNELILELTFNRSGVANEDDPGQFESLFRWAKPKLLGAGAQVEVHDESVTGP